MAAETTGEEHETPEGKGTLLITISASGAT